MTEKMINQKFEIRQGDITVEFHLLEGLQSCIRCDGELMTYQGIVDKLNEQHETIERLKGNIVELLSVSVEEELLKENEQLRLDNKRLLSDYTDVCNDNVALENENEQLKSENNMLKVTIGRNEAYIKRLTETSEWHC